MPRLQPLLFLIFAPMNQNPFVREIPPTPGETLMYLLIGAVVFYGMYYLVSKYLFKNDKRS